MECVSVNPVWWLIAALSALLVWQSHGEINRGVKSVYSISSEGTADERSPYVLVNLEEYRGCSHGRSACF